LQPSKSAGLPYGLKVRLKSMPTNHPTRSSLYAPAPLRRLAVVADLHLGRRDRADGFRTDEARFVRALLALADTVDRVVLLGDVLELTHGPVPFSLAREERLVSAARADLLALLTQPRFVWLRGNHDPVTARTHGAAHEWSLDVQGRRTLLLHGDRFDWFVQHTPGAGRLASWTGATATRLGSPWVYAWLAGLDGWFNGHDRDPARCAFVGRSLAYAQARGASTIVVGHDHHPRLGQAEGVTLVRPGSCREGRLRAARVDLVTGEAELIDQGL